MLATIFVRITASTEGGVDGWNPGVFWIIDVH
jgi:hypothetical protein